MQFYGYHGVHDSEKELGGKFEVDLELRTSLQKSIASDNLQDTIDYQAIYETVEHCLQKNKFYLLEALAGHIAKSILTQFNIDSLNGNAKISLEARNNFFLNLGSGSISHIKIRMGFTN